jgi:hypothetical protein
MIFESPDGGKTVYKRKFGEVQRYHSDSSVQTITEYTGIMLDDLLWKEIRQTAKTDDELQKVLERAKILYYLKKKDGSR